MKKNIVVVMVQCVLIAAAPAGDNRARQQAVERENSFAVSGGLNISMIAAPTMVDYINTVSNSNDAAGQLATGIELFSGVEFPVGESWGLKIDYGYLFKSYSIVPQYGGTQDIFYSIHTPSLLVQYVTSGRGYFVKVAAGGGYHPGRVETKASLYGVTNTYTTAGVGFKAELVGQTALSENLYVHLGGTLRWELLGDVTDGRGKTLRSGSSGSRDVSLSLFAAGVEIGIAWYL
ncbi:MAG: hypothetical protein NTV54_09470 [Ignavibacteriales bacterium]|nr:hypothetical protein [Ignavibacteriales bacterium]